MTHGTRIFVGLSGGVDSAVAALRLVRAGYDVTGVFIKVWQPPWLSCNWERERIDAMRVAAHLRIPFLTCDAEIAYRDAVAAYFVREYAAGRTPNPDVMCNRHVKFGAFWEFAQHHGADAIATGHYAQRIKTSEGHYALHRGADPEKDQSYFLWTLTSEELAHVRFPTGDSTKADIRAEAAAAGIPTATKRDSQGICFLGAVDICEFLGHYLDLQPGTLTTPDGTVVGRHRGAACYTLGQRHGLSIEPMTAAGVPYYVVDTDLSRNVVVVDSTPPTVAASSTLTLTDIVDRTGLQTGATLSVATRYRQNPIPATVTARTDHSVQLELSESVTTPAPGQSCVWYRDTHCLGGGIIAGDGGSHHEG